MHALSGCSEKGQDLHRSWQPSTILPALPWQLTIWVGVSKKLGTDQPCHPACFLLAACLSPVDQHIHFVHQHNGGPPEPRPLPAAGAHHVVQKLGGILWAYPIPRERLAGRTIGECQVNTIYLSWRGVYARLQDSCCMVGATSVQSGTRSEQPAGGCWPSKGSYICRMVRLHDQ